MWCFYSVGVLWVGFVWVGVKSVLVGPDDGDACGVRDACGA